MTGRNPRHGMNIIKSESSSSNGSDHQLMPLDIESNGQEGQGGKPRLLACVWMMPVNLMKDTEGHRIPSLIKLTACVMTAL